MNPAVMQPKTILDFWFTELTPKHHFAKDAALDETIHTRFGAALEAAARCDEFALRKTRWPWRWRKNWWPVGKTAACPWCSAALSFMPYMHSESALVHAQAALLFAQPGMQDTWRFELRHPAIIERFGRYPHRNALLGRESTPEELAFLGEPGSGF
jgi:uncharacterized protein (DUF924 family)